VTVACAVCGAVATRRKHRKAGVEILQCESCGLAFWVPEAGFAPEAVYDSSYFSDAAKPHGYDAYGDLEVVLRKNFSRRLARISQPRAGARLLDVGAAFGFAVAEARAGGWRAVGLEISRAAASRAATVAPGSVVVANALNAPFAGGSFDVVTLWDVLEHLADPHAAVAEVSRLLRPGGRVLLSTGDVDSLLARVSGPRWHLYTIPEHLFFYSRRSLHRLLEAHGFRVERIRADASHYTLGYLAERIRKTLLGRTAGGRGAWPGAGLSVPVNLFDIVTAEAVRLDPQ